MEVELLTSDVPLPQGHEIVVYVPWDEPSSSFIKLLTPMSRADARAEIFGCPMQPDVHYSLPRGQSFPVFGWTPCVIQVAGTKSLLRSILCSLKDPLNSTRPLAEYHFLLHEARQDAEKAGEVGPRVLICGGPCTGKHAAAKLLANYATRFGWSPIVADLSLESQSIAIPGAMAAVVQEYPTTVDEEVSSNQVTLSYFLGRLKPQIVADSDPLCSEGLSIDPTFGHYSETLAGDVMNRLQSHRQSIGASSGSICIMPALTGLDGVAAVTKLLDKFEATHCLVIGDEFLFAHLSLALSARDLARGQAKARGRRVFHAPTKSSTLGYRMLSIDRLSASPHVFPRSERYMDTLVRMRFETYFSGPIHCKIQSSEFSRQHRDIQFLVLGGEIGTSQATATVHPLDKRESVVGSIGAVVVDPSGLQRGRSSTSAAGSILQQPVAGFVRITRVDAVEVAFLCSLALPALPVGLLTILIGNVTWLQ